jgi:hypothetical protein
MSSKEAEEYLSARGVGEIVIRPSSREHDVLVITWAFQVIYENTPHYPLSLSPDLSPVSICISPACI